MTRVIGGRCGGLRLRVPTRGTRPTSDRVREALFSSVEAWLARDSRAWPDVRVLDLCAGSGALGLEAASRGAKSVTLVESDARAFVVLEQNCSAVEAALDDRGVITPMRADARRVVLGLPVDVVFVDPPYSTPDEEVRSMLARLDDQGALAPGALAVVERGAHATAPWPAPWQAVHDRTYGDTRLWYGRHG